MRLFFFVNFLNLILINFVLAENIPRNKNEFCARYSNRDIDLEIIQDFSLDPQNLMAFKNDGGLFNGGVCWWHSRFQRNIFYLSIFKPNLPKLSSDKIKILINKIRLGNEVVIIPGHESFYDFSNENHQLIQNELSKWQIYDGVFLGKWIDGLRGSSFISSEELVKKMEQLFVYVHIMKKIAYEKLQIKGITSHAWLITNIKRNKNGFNIGYLDSNYPNACLNYTYQIGDTSFFLKNYGNFVPYLEFTREESKLSSVAKAFCGKELFSTQNNLKQIENAYQQDLREAKQSF